jgi:hypothetical protein
MGAGVGAREAEALEKRDIVRQQDAHIERDLGNARFSGGLDNRADQGPRDAAALPAGLNRKPAEIEAVSLGTPED